jgi:hypothetical protein
MVTSIEIIAIAAGAGAVAGLAYYAHKKKKATATISQVTQSSTAVAPATAQATGSTAAYPQTQTQWPQVEQYVHILSQSPAWALETVSQSYESWASSGAWYTKLHAPGVTPTTAITSASTAQSTGATATYPQTQTYGPPHWPYYPKPYQPSRYPGRWMPL